MFQEKGDALIMGGNKIPRSGYTLIFVDGASGNSYELGAVAGAGRPKREEPWSKVKC